MNGRRVAAIVRRLVAEIRRDHLSIALLFVAPVLMTGLVTFILREGSSPTVDAVVVNAGGPPALTTVLVGALEAGGGTAREVASEDEARRAIEDGEASLALILPADLATAASPRLVVLTSGLDPSGDASQVAALQKSFASLAAALTGRSVPSLVHETIYGTGGDDPITSYAPAIVGFLAYFFVYLLTGVSFLRERTGGTLERLMATPVTRGEIVTGYTLGFGLFAVIQVALLMVWVLGMIEVPAVGPMPSFSVGLGVASAGSPFLAFLVVVLVALGAVSLGIFASTFARTELQIIQFIPLVISPQFLLSGVLFPVSSLPDVIQPIAPVLPLTYAVDGLRQVFIRGADLSLPALQLDLAVLAAVTVFFGAIAALTIRRDVV
jgi:ABC-2 type transport system permease protein